MKLINYLEKITDEKVYLRGVNLYRKQKVKNLIITSENNEEIITKIKSNVEASNNFTKYNIFILFSKKTLIDYSCDCIYFLKYNSFCKHLVATFLDYHSKIISSEKSNLSIDNNFSLSNLLISKYKEKSNIYFLIKNKYILNYNIVILYDKIAIELEIYNNFNKKTYKVRNIIKLLWAYIEKEIYKFTNNFIIDFKYSDFIIDKNNKKVWEILLNNQKMVDDFSIYDSNFFNGPDGFISSNQFIKILYSLKGQNINIKDKSYYNSEKLINYYISEKQYNFNFKFSHNDEILNLEINNYSKLLIDDLPILIENNILYLITFDQLEIYKPIYELLKNKENKEIIFEINNLKNIAHYLLPNLKLLQNDLILPKTIEKNIINQELEVNFHLDYENNKIIIFLSFKYGNYIFNLDNNFNPELPKDYILIRNELKEKNVEEYLLMSGFKKNDNIFYLNNDDDNYINFITKNVYELKKLGAVYYSKNFKNIKFISQPQIKIIIKNSEKNLLDFSFKINNISDHELSEIFSSINNKKEYHHLKNGSILELKDNKNNKFYKLLETLDFDLTNKKENKIKISTVNAIFLSKYLEKDNVEWENKNNYLNIFNNINNLSLNYELPIKLNAKLRNYQKFGFQWLKTLSYAKLGGVLADEMGLGKTVQTITFILSEFEYNSNLEPVIIICPSSLIYNWESEVNKFAPNLKVLVINGNPKKRQEMINNINNYQIIIISYSLLRKEINIFSNIKFSYSFIDEAQYIKNSNSLLSKNVKQINASIRFALTGTPIENSLSELWSIFDYCLPGYLLSHYKFQKIFEKPIINKNDQEKLAIFRDKIKPFILRRLKKDVINELPEKNIYNILIEMTDEQKKIYMSYVKTAKKELMKEFEEFGLEKTKIKILSILTRLRQICCDPSVFISNYNGGSGKIERLQNIIEENIKENKILIFSQFTTVLKNIYQKLQNNKIRALYLDGQTKVIERKNIINKFMSDDDYKIFLLSLKAGGVGLNLTKANIVIHFDPWWNPATENQATDRAHRIGQNNNVEVIRLIAKGTIEERIIDIHEKKIKLSQDIIDNNANLKTLLTNLTEDEINNLLKYDF